jgi:hypothetical protein
MVMVALRLQHEALQQKRDAVVALARHAARKAVKRQLQAEGTKVAPGVNLWSAVLQFALLPLLHFGLVSVWLLRSELAISMRKARP